MNGRSDFVEERFGAAFFTVLAMRRNMRPQDRRRKPRCRLQVAEPTRGEGCAKALIYQEIQRDNGPV